MLHCTPIQWTEYQRKPLPSDRVIPPKWLGDSTPCIFDKMTLWTDYSQKKKQLQPASMIVFTPAYDFCFQRVQSSRSAHSHRSVRLCWGKILLNEISSSRNIIKWTFANLQHYKHEYARLRQQIINLQNSTRTLHKIKEEYDLFRKGGCKITTCT